MGFLGMICIGITHRENVIPAIILSWQKVLTLRKAGSQNKTEYGCGKATCQDGCEQ